MPTFFGVSLVREVASRAAGNGTELDGLGHRGTLGMAMAWKWEMRTEELSKIGRAGLPGIKKHRAIARFVYPSSPIFDTS